MSLAVTFSFYFAGPAGPTGPEPNPLRNCMSTIHVQCNRPLASEYAGMTLEAVLEKIVNTDLRETCE